MFSIYATGMRRPSGGRAKLKVLADKSGLMEGGEWEIPKSVDIAATFKRIDTRGSMSGGATIEMVKGLHAMHMVRLIGDAVAVMMMDGGGEVWLDGREKGFIWDDHDIRKFTLTRYNYDKVGPEMLSWLGQSCMNKLGVMAEIAKAFAAMAYGNLPRGPFILRIEVQMS